MPICCVVLPINEETNLKIHDNHIECPTTQMSGRELFTTHVCATLWYSGIEILHRDGEGKNLTRGKTHDKQEVEL